MISSYSIVLKMYSIIIAQLTADGILMTHAACTHIEMYLHYAGTTWINMLPVNFWLAKDQYTKPYRDAHIIIVTLYVIMVCSPIQVMLA